MAPNKKVHYYIQPRTLTPKIFQYLRRYAEQCELHERLVILTFSTFEFNRFVNVESDRRHYGEIIPSHCVIPCIRFISDRRFHCLGTLFFHIEYWKKDNVQFCTDLAECIKLYILALKNANLRVIATVTPTLDYFVRTMQIMTQIPFLDQYTGVINYHVGSHTILHVHDPNQIQLQLVDLFIHNDFHFKVNNTAYRASVLDIMKCLRTEGKPVYMKNPKEYSFNVGDPTVEFYINLEVAESIRQLVRSGELLPECLGTRLLIGKLIEMYDDLYANTFYARIHIINSDRTRYLIHFMNAIEFASNEEAVKEFLAETKKELNKKSKDVEKKSKIVRNLKDIDNFIDKKDSNKLDENNPEFKEAAKKLEYNLYSQMCNEPDEMAYNTNIPTTSGKNSTAKTKDSSASRRKKKKCKVIPPEVKKELIKARIAAAEASKESSATKQKVPESEAKTTDTTKKNLSTTTKKTLDKDPSSSYKDGKKKEIETKEHSQDTRGKNQELDKCSEPIPISKSIEELKNQINKIENASEKRTTKIEIISDILIPSTSQSKMQEEKKINENLTSSSKQSIMQEQEQEKYITNEENLPSTSSQNTIKEQSRQKEEDDKNILSTSSHINVKEKNPYDTMMESPEIVQAAKLINHRLHLQEPSSTTKNIVDRKAIPKEFNFDDLPDLVEDSDDDDYESHLMKDIMDEAKEVFEKDLIKKNAVRMKVEEIGTEDDIKTETTDNKQDEDVPDLVDDSESTDSETEDSQNFTSDSTLSEMGTEDNADKKTIQVDEIPKLVGDIDSTISSIEDRLEKVNTSTDDRKLSEIEHEGQASSSEIQEKSDTDEVKLSKIEHEIGDQGLDIAAIQKKLLKIGTDILEKNASNLDAAQMERPPSPGVDVVKPFIDAGDHTYSKKLQYSPNSEPRIVRERIPPGFQHEITGETSGRKHLSPLQTAGNVVSPTSGTNKRINISLDEHGCLKYDNESDKESSEDCMWIPDEDETNLQEQERNLREALGVPLATEEDLTDLDPVEELAGKFLTDEHIEEIFRISARKDSTINKSKETKSEKSEQQTISEDNKAQITETQVVEPNKSDSGSKKGKKGKSDKETFPENKQQPEPKEVEPPKPEGISKKSRRRKSWKKASSEDKQQTEPKDVEPPKPEEISKKGKKGKSGKNASSEDKQPTEPKDVEPPKQEEISKKGKSENKTSSEDKQQIEPKDVEPPKPEVTSKKGKKGKSGKKSSSEDKQQTEPKDVEPPEPEEASKNGKSEKKTSSEDKQKKEPKDVEPPKPEETSKKGKKGKSGKNTSSEDKQQSESKDVEHLKPEESSKKSEKTEDKKTQQTETKTLEPPKTEKTMIKIAWKDSETVSIQKVTSDSVEPSSMVPFRMTDLRDTESMKPDLNVPKITMAPLAVQEADLCDKSTDSSTIPDFPDEFDDDAPEWGLVDEQVKLLVESLDDDLKSEPTKAAKKEIQEPPKEESEKPLKHETQEVTKNETKEEPEAEPCEASKDSIKTENTPPEATEKKPDPPIENEPPQDSNVNTEGVRRFFRTQMGKPQPEMIDFKTCINFKRFVNELAQFIKKLSRKYYLPHSPADYLVITVYEAERFFWARRFCDTSHYWRQAGAAYITLFESLLGPELFRVPAVREEAKFVVRELEIYSMAEQIPDTAKPEQVIVKNFWIQNIWTIKKICYTLRENQLIDELSPDLFKTDHVNTLIKHIVTKSHEPSTIKYPVDCEPIDINACFDNLKPHGSVLLVERNLDVVPIVVP